MRLVSMNCWRFDARIFEACRDVPRSARGEYRNSARRSRSRSAAASDSGRSPRAAPSSTCRGAPTPWRSPAAGRRHAAPVTRAESLAAALVERGLDAHERARRPCMFDRVLAASRATPAASRTHAWWVPGRLEVFGKHTDYAGGRTLVAAVPRGFVVVARPRADGELHVVDAKRGEAFVLHPADTTCTAAGVTMSRWSRAGSPATFPARRSAPTSCSRATCRARRGMSSSSALVVEHRRALCARRRRSANARGVGGEICEPARCSPAISAASRTACRSATLAGDAGVGTHGGSEDHAAIVTRSSGQLDGVSLRANAAPPRRARPASWRFVLSPCGVAARKTGAEMHKYNRLSEGARVLLDSWNASEAPAPSLGSAIAAEGSVTRFRELIAAARIAGWTPEALERRLDHFIREDARIELRWMLSGRRPGPSGAAVRQVPDRCRDVVGKPDPGNHRVGAVSPELGAFASCSFGAGFGGSVWALVERAKADQFARRWHAEAFVASPAPPLTEL